MTDHKQLQRSLHKNTLNAAQSMYYSKEDDIIRVSSSSLQCPVLNYGYLIYGIIKAMEKQHLNNIALKFDEILIQARLEILNLLQLSPGTDAITIINWKSIPYQVQILKRFRATRMVPIVNIGTSVYSISNPLVVILGIGKFKGYRFNWNSVKMDYSNIIGAFHMKRGFDTVYYTTIKSVSDCNI